MTTNKEVLSAKVLPVNPSDYGVEKTQAVELTKNLRTTLEEREVLIEQYNQVITLEITPENVKRFSELRKLIKNNRTKGIEAWHKANKQYFLAGGRFVDAIKNKESLVNEQMEEKLEAAEKYFENLEKEAKEKLRTERLAEISQYMDNSEMYPLADLSEEAYQNLLNGAKLQKEQKEKEEKEAEQKRQIELQKDHRYTERRYELAKYAQFSEMFATLDVREMDNAAYNTLISALQDAQSEYNAEQERIKAENEILRKERKEVERKAEAERKRLQEEQDKKIAAERKAREEAERKLKEKEAEEQRIEQERLAGIKRKQEQEAALKLQGEKAQLLAWIDNFAIPNAPTENNPMANDIVAKFNNFKSWAKTLVNQVPTVTAEPHKPQDSPDTCVYSDMKDEE